MFKILSNNINIINLLWSVVICLQLQLCLHCSQTLIFGANLPKRALNELTAFASTTELGKLFYMLSIDAVK